MWLRFRFRYLRHPLSLFGVWLTTVSAILFLVVFVAELLGMHANPYIGIIFFLVLPGLFVLGLLLIPAGVWLTRRRERQGRPAGVEWPVVDMNSPHTRFIVFAVAAATVVNIVVISLAAYRGVEYMDSVAFCGQVCHTVMEPEFTAYQHGPHARVACVACHIGPGAPWFVRSKLSGTRQLFAVALNTYPTPIPSPVENLRPARETCEQCHWPEKFTGDRIRQVYEHADDEANTVTETTLRLHVGSGQQRLGATGIHWHMSPSVRVSYITTDRKRQVIPWVQVEDAGGEVRVYRAEGVSDEELARGERREMDCMDCHNRPSHRFDFSPERAVTEALAHGQISPDLPFIYREAVEALKVKEASQEAGARRIANRLSTFYRSQYPTVWTGRRGDVDAAVRMVQGLYTRNVFPTMDVTWGTYVNNIGHVEGPGCFRCHDDGHGSPDGRTIGQDCSTCHTLE
ncbi:MAG TPA: NapC/NirT family cytochrome c [Vicinamibacterales bacterium]|nr:NapC/NirT family cytochrome c [Vicinamibacterales bacterium]